MQRKMKTYLKRALMALAALVVAITWSGSGETQSACVIDRGQDPLDIVSTLGVKHNVWILLDITGSMREAFGNTSERKIDAAVRVLKYIVSNTKDSAGAPLVNWSFSVFGGCNPDANDQCQGCAIGATLEVPLPTCGNDNTNAVLNAIRVRTRHNTPIGKSLSQTADIVARTPLYPGQKHFVLLATDGQETCENSSDQNMAGRQIQYDQKNPSLFRTASYDSEYRTVRSADLAKSAIAKIDPKGDASVADVFTIGMGLNSTDKELTNHIAWNASNNRRAALFADNPDQLIQAIQTALSQISTPPATVSLTNPVVGTVKELIPGDVMTVKGTRGVNPYVATRDVLGKYSPLAPNVRAQNRNNVLFSTSTELPSFKTRLVAQKVFDVVQTGNAQQRVIANFATFWDAGEELQKRSAESRTVFFSRSQGARAGELVPFRASTNPNQGVTPDDLGVGVRFLDDLDGTVGKGAKTSLDAAKMVVGVLRGYRLSLHKDTGTFYKPVRLGSPQESNDLNLSEFDEKNLPTWKLFEASHAGPTLVVSPARSPSDPPRDSPQQRPDQNYSAFFNKYIDRQSVVYMGTNDGMMHAFRADTGYELFAYIPDDLVGLAPGEAAGSRRTLQDLVKLLVGNTNNVQNHFYGISGSATADDVYLRKDRGGDDNWHTVIAFGRGAGSKFVTALDVTQVGDWDGTLMNTAFPETGDRVPKLLFNVGNRNWSGNRPDAFDGMGETWSTPTLGEVRLLDTNSQNLLPQWVLFAGSGYGCTGTMEGRYFYVLRLEDGAIVKSYGPITSAAMATVKNNVLVASATAFNAHLFDPTRQDQSDYVTRVYIGDLQGNLYKLDSSASDPQLWSFSTFYSSGSDPRLGPDQPFSAPVALLYRQGTGPSVFAGTGGDRRIVKTGDARYYMLGLYDNTANGATPSSGVPIPVQSGGYLQNGGSFVMPLAFGERAYVGPASAPSALGGSVFFAASTPGDPTLNCRLSFASRLYGFLAASGLGAFDADLQGRNGKTPLDAGSGKISGLYSRDEHLFVGRSGGFGVDGSTRILGDAKLPQDVGSTPGGISLMVERYGNSVF